MRRFVEQPEPVAAARRPRRAELLTFGLARELESGRLRPLIEQEAQLEPVSKQREERANCAARLASGGRELCCCWFD